MDNKSAPYAIRLNILQLAEEIVRNKTMSKPDNYQKYDTEAILSTANTLYAFVSKNTKESS